MNSRILGLRVASAIFAVVSLLQLVRVVTQIEVLAGGHRIPLWASVVAFVITGGLSLWLWRLAKSEDR